MRVLVSGFHAGEFSDLLDGRTDLQQTATGCRKLRNFIPRGTGGAFKRPGFYFAGMQRNNDTPTRLLPFAFNRSVTYRIELGEQFTRFWRGNALCVHQISAPMTGLLSQPGEPLVVGTPWTSAEAFRVQFAQANDVTWLTHESHWPRRLIRYGVEDWRIEEMPVTAPPMRDPNFTATAITPSGVSGIITLTASSSIFSAGDVGGYYEISRRRELPYQSLTLNATSPSDPGIRILGKWEVFTYGKWNGVLKLQKLNGAVWETVRSWLSTGDKNVQSNGETDGNSMYRLNYEGSGTAIDGILPRAELQAIDAVIRGTVRITEYLSPTELRAEVTRTLNDALPTTQWAEGAWSQRRGFPRAVCLHNQRIVFGGTRSQGQSVWGSAINGFDDYQRSTLDEGAFTYQVAAQTASPISWITSQKGLFIGTEGEEYLMDGGRDSESITATKVRAERRSGIGSSHLPALLVGSAMIFVQSGESILSEYIFDQSQNGFDGVNLTQLADHFGEELFVQLAYAQNPHSIVWAVTGEGSLLSLTYQRRAQVLAWAKHTTPGGKFESVCVTPGPGGIDEVWVSVRREIDGRVLRTIERFDPAHWKNLRARNQEALNYGDSAVIRTGTAMTEVTGLEHLEGATVTILVDGAGHPPRRVDQGKITIARPASTIIVGLPFLAELQPFAPDVQLDTGSSFGRRIRVPEVDVKLWNSSSLSYADAPGASVYEALFRSSADATGVAIPLYTGQKKLTMGASWRDSPQILLTDESMLPLNVLAMVQQVQISGD